MYDAMKRSRDEFTAHSERVERSLKIMRREGRLTSKKRVPLQPLDTNKRIITNKKKEQTSIPMSCLTLSLRELKRPQPPLQVKTVSSTNDMCKMFMASKDLFCQSIEGHHTIKLMEQVVDWMQINQFQYKSNSSNKNTNDNLNGSNESISGLPTNTSLALVIKGYGYKRSMGPSLVAKINDTHKLGKYLVSCQVTGMDHEILLIKPDSSLCITTGDTIELFVKTKIIKTINGKSMDLYLNWKVIR